MFFSHGGFGDALKREGFRKPFQSGKEEPPSVRVHVGKKTDKKLCNFQEEHPLHSLVKKKF